VSDFIVELNIVSYFLVKSVD